ncbi:MAG: DUF1707 domain-containing protein [Streptosporangiales bacterium]|nr:DUF1707 domain-containing protein [Streptosporangiales bacterium]
MSDSTGRDPMTYRASDGDREHTAEILREAAGDGRITLDELDTRLTDTFAARTYAELARLTDDIPPAAPGALAPIPPGGVPVPTADAGPLVLKTSGGGIQRKGRWLVPARIELDGTYGSVQLDFREAVFAAPVTTLVVRTKYGSVYLTLPDGATAQVDITSAWGTIRSAVPAIPVPGHPHLVVTGESSYGSVRLRYGVGHKVRRRRNKGD